MVVRIKGMKCVSLVATALAMAGCQKSQTCPQYETVCNSVGDWRQWHCDKFPDAGATGAVCPSIQEVESACPVLAPLLGGPTEQDGGMCCYRERMFCS